MNGYNLNKSSQENEKIIKEFLPKIRYTAYRLSRGVPLPPQISCDDLISAGLEGLHEAMGKFEPGKAQLRTYAHHRIKGSMLDELRAFEWIPRPIKEKLRILKGIQGDLEKKLKRPPEDEEVAEALKISLDNYYQILKESEGGIPFKFENFESLSVHSTDNIEHPNNEDPLSRLEELDQKKILAHLIDGLPENEKMTIFLYYWLEMTMKQVGLVMGLTESRVCQLHKQALIRLKININKERNLDFKIGTERRSVQPVDCKLGLIKERRKDGQNRINRPGGIRGISRQPGLN
jgi:RNA polymerase sigma factor FliA